MIISSYTLKKKILKDKYNSIIFKKGKGSVFLVGGYVRDILRGVKSSDRDYIITDRNLRPFVHEISSVIGGTVVEFKKDTMIRIALKNGATCDFSNIQGTLENDLSKRDFTINAIAWSLKQGLVDFYHGLQDIEKKKISSLSIENLIADPLRMLRAYRIGAELGGSIEQETRKMIKTLHNKIKEVSPERITLELFHLLNSNNAAKYTKMAFLDGILSDILFISDKVLEKNIRALSKLERSVLKKLPQRIKLSLKRLFSQNLTYKGLLSLIILLQGAFYIPMGIKLSNVIKKRIERAQGGIQQIRGNKLTAKSRIFDIFLYTKEASEDVLIISGREDLFQEYKRFKNIWKNGLISSEEIIKITNIINGRELGVIIYTLRKAQFYKRVKTKQQAIKFIKVASA